MSNRLMLILLVFCAFAICAGTTGCKKSDEAVIIIQPNVGGPHYYAVDMYGDLVNAQVNVASETCSFFQLEGPSPIGVGKSDLTPAGGGLGIYAYYDEEGNMWAVNPDKFVVMGGDGNIVIGVPVYSGTYPATVIADMYNYLSFEYDSHTGEVDAYYGTLDIDAAGTWKIYESIDGTTNPASNTDSGTWTDKGNGRISIMVDSLGGARIGNIAVFPSASGNILIMNYGVMGIYGMIIGLPQASIATGDLNGTYDAINWEDTVFAQVVVLDANVTVDGNPADTLTFDSPWTGMISAAAGVYLIGSQDGLVVRIEVKIGNDDMTIITIE